jgi:hypothetical protein
MKQCDHTFDAAGQQLPTRAKARPTIEELREYLDYEPETGVLRWKKSCSTRIKPGDIVRGKNCGGYLRVRLHGVLFYAHRVAFAVAHGRWPHPFCDHINGDVSDNRASNLRECNFSESVHNTRRSRNNTSGFKGVARHKQSGGWWARAQLRGKKYGKYFKRLEDAAAYAKQLREQLHGEFARH